MAQDAEALIERRKLRRKLTVWRVAFLLLLAALIAGVASYSMRGPNYATPHVAKVRIEGTIFENEELLKRLDKIADDDAVKGVILILDSPGGTTVGANQFTKPYGKSLKEAGRNSGRDPCGIGWLYDCQRI